MNLYLELLFVTLSNVKSFSNKPHNSEQSMTRRFSKMKLPNITQLLEQLVRCSLRYALLKVDAIETGRLLAGSEREE